MELSSIINVRNAIIVIIIIIIIWIYTTTSNFMSSPLGKALSKVFGAAGTIIGSMASNPIGWLIGAGLLYLLGPALFKISRKSAVDLADRVKNIYEKNPPKSDAVAEAQINKLEEAAKNESIDKADINKQQKMEENAGAYRDTRAEAVEKAQKMK